VSLSPNCFQRLKPTGHLQLLLSPATLDQVGCLLRQNVELANIVFRGLIGRAPVGGDHPDDISRAGDQRRGSDVPKLLTPTPPSILNGTQSTFFSLSTLKSRR